MPETTEPTPAAPAPLPDRHAVGPHGEQPASPPEPRGPRLTLVEPRVGQKARIHLPERRTQAGRPIPVMRPGNPARPYQQGEVVRWDDHLVFLRQEGAVLATEIVE